MRRFFISFPSHRCRDRHQHSLHDAHVYASQSMHAYAQLNRSSSSPQIRFFLSSPSLSSNSMPASLLHRIGLSMISDDVAANNSVCINAQHHDSVSENGDNRQVIVQRCHHLFALSVDDFMKNSRHGILSCIQHLLSILIILSNPTMINSTNTTFSSPQPSSSSSSPSSSSSSSSSSPLSSWHRMNACVHHNCGVALNLHGHLELSTMFMQQALVHHARNQEEEENSEEANTDASITHASLAVNYVLSAAHVSHRPNAGDAHAFLEAAIHHLNTSLSLNDRHVKSHYCLAIIHQFLLASSSSSSSSSLSSSPSLTMAAADRISLIHFHFKRALECALAHNRHRQSHTLLKIEAQYRDFINVMQQQSQQQQKETEGGKMKNQAYDVPFSLEKANSCAMTEFYTTLYKRKKKQNASSEKLDDDVKQNVNAMKGGNEANHNNRMDNIKTKTFHVQNNDQHSTQAESSNSRSHRQPTNTDIFASLTRPDAHADSSSCTPAQFARILTALRAQSLASSSSSSSSSSSPFRVLLLSGAGLSRSSGLLTRKDLWCHSSGAYSRDACVSIWDFMRDPVPLYKLIYEFLLPTEFKPKTTPAHRAIHGMMMKGYVHTICTQNVDGLHEQAAENSEIDIHTLHGTLSAVVCMSCGTRTRVPLSFYDRRIYERNNLKWPPRCQVCLDPDRPLSHLSRALSSLSSPSSSSSSSSSFSSSFHHHPQGGTVIGVLKPDVVLFGELSQSKLSEILKQHYDVLIVVGTAADVYPASELPLHFSSLSLARARDRNTSLSSSSSRPKSTLIVSVNSHVDIDRATMLTLTDCIIKGDADSVMEEINKNI